MVHRSRLFNKSVKNKDSYISEGYSQRILDTLSSLPDSLPEDKHNVCIVKHSRNSAYTAALSAAAVMMIVVGSVYAYTKFSSMGRGDGNDPHTAVTTVTTDASDEKSNNTSTSSYKEFTTISVTETTTAFSEISSENHDIAGNTDIFTTHTDRTYRAQTGENKQTASVYYKKETENAAQTTKAKTTDKAEPKTEIKETRKAEKNQTETMPDHVVPDDKKPFVTAPPIVTLPVPPVHTDKENEKPDNDFFENNKDFPGIGRVKESPDKDNGKTEEEKAEDKQDFHEFGNVKGINGPGK